MTTTITTPKTLTEATFHREVLESKRPVLVDFWAPWCGPCHVMAPVIDDLATAFEKQATVGKVNVDEHPQLAIQYGIRSIPTVLLFKDGQVVDRSVGVVAKQVLSAKLQALV